MDKKVIFINPPMSPLEENLYIPLHYISLGAVAEQSGWKVEIIDFDFIFKSKHVEPNLNFIIERLSEIQCGEHAIFGLTAYGHNVWLACEMGKKLREFFPNATLLMGGPEATFSAEAILRSADFDAVIRGEGEETFREILKSDRKENHNPDGALKIDFSVILGITYKKDDHVIANAERTQIADLDHLPLPAYHLIDVVAYTQHPDFVKFHIEAGRGCPFNCTFCSTSLVWKRKYRVKSVDRLLKEVSDVQTRFGWNNFDFVHDNLVFKKDYIHSLCDTIQNQKLNIQWSCTSRSDHIAKETIQKMRETGCSSIFFGIESGNWDRQRQIRKRIKPEQTLQTIQYCAESGMGCTASFILGYPDESKEELNETLSFAHLLKLQGATVVQAPVLHPHTGTELYRGLYSALRFGPLVNGEHSLSKDLVPGEKDVESHKDLYTFSLSFRSHDQDEYYYHLRSFFVVFMECYPLTISLILREKNVSLLDLLESFIVSEKDSALLNRKQLDRREIIIGRFSKSIQGESALIGNIFKYEDAWRKIKSMVRATHREPRSSGQSLIYISSRSVFERFDFDLASLIAYAQSEEMSFPETRSNYILFKAEGEEGIAVEIDETAFKICTWISDHKEVNFDELDSLRFSLNKEKRELDQVIQSLCEEGILISQKQKQEEVTRCLRS